MEYLTELVTTVPEGTSPAKVDELRAAEAVRAAELAKAILNNQVPPDLMRRLAEVKELYPS
jgi:muconolactone delta-isomerase